MAQGDPHVTQHNLVSTIAGELRTAGFDDVTEVGQGGFGAVYRCTQRSLDRTVAVKVLTSGLEPDNVERFVREQRAMARWWDAEVKRQSLALSGSLDAYRQFVDDTWNWYDYPDPSDMPSSLPEHLQWLADAGFTGVDVFWARAGHAVYGGYKPAVG